LTPQKVFYGISPEKIKSKEILNKKVFYGMRPEKIKSGEILNKKVSIEYA